MARIVFMGTPDYAKTILASIWSPQDTYLVITKPDMPVGRRQVMTPSPVSRWAEEQGLAVLKPMRLADIRLDLEAFDPDYILTAAFGRILRPWLIELPRFGAYNLHASLLPRWRGPNPVAWAIRSLDETTGVTLMQMDAGIDTGPIVAQTSVAIHGADTVATLTERLSRVAAELWRDTLEQRGPGSLEAVPQPLCGATAAPKFRLEDAHLDFGKPVRQVDSQLRSATPDPGAWALWGALRVKVLAAEVAGDQASDDPGYVLWEGRDWLVACNPGLLRIRLIHPEGRRPMQPGDFMRGQHGVSTGHLR